MPRVHAAFVCAVIVLAAATADAEGHVIAVLPLDVKMTKGKMDDASQASLEEMLRDVAVDALSSDGWTVLTGETTLQILQDNGVDVAHCGDQSCHLSMAREIKAEKFMSGAVQYADGEFTASIRLIDTATGRILASERLEGKNVKALRTEFEGKAATFFTRGGLTGMTGTATAADVSSSSGSTGLTVTSEPPGAAVRIDGEAAGKTPLHKALAPGSYYVTLESEGYATLTKQVTVEAGRTATFSGQLFRTAGFIDVSVHPESARVTIDGNLSSAGRQGPFAVGAHTLHAEAAGYAPSEVTVQVENGATASAAIALTALPGKILVSVNVAADCRSGGVTAKATPSDIGVLVVPAGPATVTCSRDGYGTVAQTVGVDPGKTMAITLTLVKDDRPTPGALRVEPRTGLERLYIPGGTFHFGCEPGDTSCFDDEKPGREATVQPFWLGKTEVTAAAYTQCVQSGSCTGASADPPDRCTYKRSDKTNHPINCIDWNQAVKFCQWVGGRLPTAEEWEIAAKNGASRIYPWGNTPPDGMRANLCDKNCPQADSSASSWANMSVDDGYAATSPVGSYPAGATPLGLVDMVGNVWEWTSTDYGAGTKEFRGAGWYDAHVRGRSSHRLGATPVTTAVNLGVRCAFDR